MSVTPKRECESFDLLRSLWSCGQLWIESTEHWRPWPVLSCERASPQQQPSSEQHEPDRTPVSSQPSFERSWSWKRRQFAWCVPWLTRRSYVSLSLQRHYVSCERSAFLRWQLA